MGLPLEEAVRRLEQAGVAVKVVWTRPWWGRWQEVMHLPQLPARVVRVRAETETELAVAPEMPPGDPQL